MGKSFPVPSLFGSDFDKFFVGYDNLFENIQKQHDALTKGIPNYPPYNISKIDENKYLVELAIAGFAKQDVEITLDGDTLSIKGSTQDDNSNFIYKGIANRAFTRTFTLGDHIEVQNAELLNGMLKIWLERIIPDYKKVKKITIKDQPTDKPSPTYLTEGDDV